MMRGAYVYASDPAPTQSDFGGAGLWQTPTARMADAGELAFTASRTEPYTRYNVTMQPAPWFEGSFRYIAITNRPYGAVAPDQSYKDKSFDAKVLLKKESRYWPAIALGGRDVAGTGHFSSEYFVASKRFGNFDTSLGLGWGYLGRRGDIDNPFNIFGRRFKRRPTREELSNTGGEFNTISYFRGAPAFFGGVSYKFPNKPIELKLEYEGNDYRHEPQGNNQRATSPFNVGMVYRYNRNLDLSVAFERGTTMMFGFTLHTNMVNRREPAKVLDAPLPPRPKQGDALSPPEQVDWAQVSQELGNNAGLRVSKISQRGSELFVTAEQNQYFYPAKGVGRAARVLDTHVNSDVDWYTVVSEREGLEIAETSISRKRFGQLVDNEIDLKDFRRSVEQNVPFARNERVLYEAPLDRYTGGFSVSYAQNLGGPDAFLLYKVALAYDAEYRFTKNFWFSGNLTGNLFDNYDKFKYTAPSRLPRVRTYVREYLTTSRINIPQFQLTATRRLGDDWYGMAYAGLLESMYGGAGGEILYRPLGRRWALGADLNWVRQRSFEQDFSFRPYKTVTGHVTGYLDTGYHDVTLAVSAGRYLAKDWGLTFDVSKNFKNGMRMGAYATFTNVSAAEFGEGSFDKGIYVSIPFDLLQAKSTVNRARFVWAPLIRDGGARLGRRYSLYTLTEDREADRFDENLHKILE